MYSDVSTTFFDVKRKMNFGERLQKLMAEQSLTQAELARIMDVPQQSISRWVNTPTPPRATTLQKLAHALEVPESRLLEGVYGGGIENQQVFPQLVLRPDGLFPDLGSRAGDLAMSTWSTMPVQSKTNRVGWLKMPDASMEPSLMEGDIVLLDRSERGLIGGRVSAIRIESRIQFRRAFLQVDGGVTLSCDHPDKQRFPSLDVSFQQRKSLIVLGLVLFTMGRR
jgi:transcriptional regulator with XRE-family HTH domain